MPKIFYFDNFLENQFPNKVNFPDEYFSDPNCQLNEHQTIVEGMFNDAGQNLKGFLNETDQNTKDTVISEVNSHVTKKLIEDWKKMNFKNQDPELGFVADIKIDLQQNRTENHSLDVNIIEEFKDKTSETKKTSMPLEERSLGFRWFFNFVSKKNFSAKGEDRFIYLFDEPGSYLHNGAQSVLLKAICDLAATHPVIYTTHSEFLLDPEIININNIKVAEKNDREIRLIPLAQTKNKKNEGALSTLYNALRMKIPISSTLSQKVIVTEGITDFYFWKMLIKKIVFLPGFGAGKNEYLISIAIGTSKKYLALFDGDDSGSKEIERYKKYFGDDESINWKQYENANDQQIKLEQILSTVDQRRLLQATTASDLKKAITSLYFSTGQNDYWANIDDETKANIKKNTSLIKSMLRISSTYFNYGIGI